MRQYPGSVVLLAMFLRGPTRVKWNLAFFLRGRIFANSDWKAIHAMCSQIRPFPVKKFSPGVVSVPQASLMRECTQLVVVVSQPKIKERYIYTSLCFMKESQKQEFVSLDMMIMSGKVKCAIWWLSTYSKMMERWSSSSLHATSASYIGYPDIWEGYGYGNLL